MSIVHGVNLFRTGPYSLVAVDWSDNPKNVILNDNAVRGEATYISPQNNRHWWFKMRVDGCIGQCSFQLLEPKFGIRNSYPFDLYRRARVLHCLEEI